VTRTFKIALPYAEIMRTLAAAGVGIALAGCVLLVSTSLAAQTIAGAVYGIGCIGGSIVLGVWTTSDVSIISDLTGRRPRLRTILNWLERHARHV
jgi:DNA-binding transcriptional LysR family regulator